MNAQIEGVGVATQNANDGVSIIEVADGTLSEVHDMLQRMNELCIKASTGTMTEDAGRDGKISECLADGRFQQSG